MILEVAHLQLIPGQAAAFELAFSQAQASSAPCRATADTSFSAR